MGTSVKHVALASAQNLGSLMNPPTSATASSRGLQQFRDLSGPPAQQQQQQQQLAGGSFGGGLGYTQPFNATAGRSGRQSTGRANNAMVSASARGDAASARGSGGGIGGGGSSSSSSSRSAQPSARASARQAASSARSRVGGGATNAGGAATRAQCPRCVSFSSLLGDARCGPLELQKQRSHAVPFFGIACFLCISCCSSKCRQTSQLSRTAIFRCAFWVADTDWPCVRRWGLRSPAA
jgi:hypothetical protein